MEGSEDVVIVEKEKTSSKIYNISRQCRHDWCLDFLMFLIGGNFLECSRILARMGPIRRSSVYGVRCSSFIRLSILLFQVPFGNLEKLLF